MSDHPQFSYKNGSLYADGVSIKKLAQEHGTPLYVYSATAFETRYRALERGLAPLRDLTICYALKANSNIAIIKMMGKLGAGADLVSGGELERARLAGIPGKRVVFSGVGKTPEEISAGLQYSAGGREKGITSFHVESGQELIMINAVARAMGSAPARVALRFNPNIDAKTHPYISTGLKRNKFGLNAAEVREAVSLLPELKHVNLCGMSIHIGSQLTSLKPLKEAFQILGREILNVESTLGRPLEFADLGGGVGIQYKDETPPRIADYCKEVLRAFGPSSAFKNRLRILLEPGRVLSGNSGVLVSQVLFRKPRPSKDFLILDAGMNDLMRPALYGSFHDLLPVEQSKGRGKKKNTDIVGPVCESGDCFGSDRMISTALESGDLVAFMSAGAYGMSMSSNYNTRPRPAEILVSGSRARVIRDREQIADLVRGEHA
jgi:diaminopimelate decarboxylase